VPAGTALTVVSDLTIRAGGVFEAFEVRGCVTILTAQPVTLRNMRVTGAGANCFGGMVGNDNAPAGGSLLLDHVEALCSDGRSHGFWVHNATLNAVKSIGCENGAEINANTIVRDSYFKTREATSEGHGDGIQSQGGDNVLIQHNTLLEDNPVTSAIITNPDLNRNWSLVDNFLGGGAYTLYCPENGKAGWRVIGNRFVAKGQPGGAAYGMTDACNGLPVWSNNRYDHNGATVSP
jgi:hypothetical protein